jgi:hypothetical protein
VTRQQLRGLTIRDLASKTLRWALHLSEEEMQFLERNNPDTLGCLHDPAQYKAEWARFINHPESKPYKVRG